jgi:hypothetical protein
MGETRSEGNGRLVVFLLNIDQIKDVSQSVYGAGGVEVVSMWSMRSYPFPSKRVSPTN